MPDRRLGLVIAAGPWSPPMIAGVTTIRVTELTRATGTDECQQRNRAGEGQRRCDEDQNMASPASVIPAAG